MPRPQPTGLRDGLRLGWRHWRRDLRAGTLRLLMLSVMLAVAAVSAVGFLSDRIQSALWRDARQLLGGDLVVVSDQPLPATFDAQARTLGLQVNQNLSFPTMARSLAGPDAETLLVALKAVREGYPLRGQLWLRTDTQTPATPAAGQVPAPGQAWVDPGLLASLDLKLGDRIGLGQHSVQITRLIDREPDRGSGFLNFAPRVMVHADDLPATGLVQPASRISWRTAVLGPDPQVARFQTWAQAQADRPDVRGVRIESLESGRPEMRQTLDRASQFLQLVALLTALLCAVALALAARQHAERERDTSALLRVLGQSQRTLLTAYTTEFLLAGLLACAMGLALGYGLHLAFVQWLAGLVDQNLPAPSPWPALAAMGMGLTLLAAFGLPPIMQLARVPALRVIRRELGAVPVQAWLVALLGLLGFALTLLLASRDMLLGGLTLGGFALALGAFAALAYLGLRVLQAVVGRSGSSHGPWHQALQLATRQVSSRPMASVVQISALSAGLLALALLVLVRTDLIRNWQQATPPDAPDRFVINIMPEQADAFARFLDRQGVGARDWYPMIRGRLVAINGREVRPEDMPEGRAQRLLDREFNLSTAEQAPSHNRIVAGRWTPGERDGMSVETGIAETLGLKLGDRLRFDVGGMVHEARITSLREVDWSSMRANFFVMFPLADLPELPRTQLAAFRTPPQSPRLQSQMLREFPNVTSIDMGSTLQQVQRVLDQVIRAVEFLFLFSLLAGMLVLMAALGAGRRERERELGILRALGAQRPLLARMQRLELWGQGFLAGFMASAVALALGWVLATRVLALQWQAPLWAPLIGGLAGALLAWAAGSLSLRGVLQRPVVQTLRQADA